MYSKILMILDQRTFQTGSQVPV